jgi:hypothetical protein
MPEGSWTRTAPQRKGTGSAFDIGASRAAGIARQYGEARVVLSFGAADGGAYFGKWLRHQIMQRFGYTEINNVYLDTVSLAEVPDTSFKKMADAKKPWITGVASMNGGWRAYYRNAIEQCHTMIFVVTPAWSRSVWCGGEFKHFLQVNRWRLESGQKPIHGIALMAGGTIDSANNLDRLQIEDNAFPIGYENWWQIDGTALLRLFGMIGRP